MTITKYWLFKSEPDAFSIDDLEKSPKKTTRWDGVRNYQARNMLRDDVQSGDQVFFYHSNAKPPGIIGIAEVVSAPYPDPSQFDPRSQYYDVKATPDKPRWFSVDVKFKQKFPALVSLDTLRQQTALLEMVLLQQGRLSIQPVRASEWRHILKLANVK